MFGLSFAKLLVLVGLILFVWYGFKFLARLQALHQAAERRRTEGARGTDARSSERGREIEELVKCRVCGSYVSAQGPAPCGRADCPAGR